MLEKRQPSLADKVLLAPPAIHVVDETILNRIRSRIKGPARRFIFDDEASRRFGEVIRDVPDLLLREEQFARAPFDVTWIEFNFLTFTSVVKGHDPNTTTADETIGFLIDHGTVYTVAGGTVSDQPAILPFVYDLHTEWSVEEQLEFCQQVQTSRAQLDATFWGTTLLKLDAEAQRRLRARHVMRILPLSANIRDKLINKKGTLSDLYYQTVGDLRNAVTALLLLNRPSLTVYKHEMPHHRTFVRGKLKPYLAHTVISIPLDPRPTMRLVGTADDGDVLRRRHEVRGHFCHDQKGRSGRCVHEWAVDLHEDDDLYSPDHWQCKLCEGKRWWRKAHERGSSVEGYNLHTFSITA